MIRLKRNEEGIYEIFLNIFMPVWLPLKAIHIIIKEILEERRKREEE